MGYLGRLGGHIAIPISADEKGFAGRECPQHACEGYFKVVLGTGLDGEGLPCHCPYCGHTAQHDEFWTKEQIEYAKSVALRKITSALRQDLKRLEFNHRPKGAFGIGISMKMEPSPSTPIHYYREERLETEVVCRNCTLRYAVYGVFAFCPDCGQHNSLQIFDENLRVIEKMLDLVAGVGAAVAEKLVENALEDCVSALDGFGHELCRVHANRALRPAEATRVSFQNLDGARVGLLNKFGIDLGAVVTPETWREAVTAFQKRHVVAHRLSVADQEYMDKTGDRSVVAGRKIVVDAAEVRRLMNVVHTLARSLSAEFEKLKDDP